jgi:uncharacterized protein (TIGR02145 family)
MNNIKILISSILVTILLNSTLYAVCASNIDLGDKAIITSATEFSDDAYVTKSYAKGMLGDVNNTDTVTDVDGNVYKTAQFSYQTWMVENMRVRNYTNDDGTKGTAIAHDSSSDGSDGWESNENCYSFLAKYGTDTEGDENDLEFKGFGLLYQWDAAMNGSTTEGARGICPIDWHMPTNDDWDNLQKILGDGSTENDKWENGEDENIGTSLKYGKFQAIPMTGYRNMSGAKWSNRGKHIYFWSNLSSGDAVWERNLNANEAGILRATTDKSYGFPVRCIKD